MIVFVDNSDEIDEKSEDEGKNVEVRKIDVETTVVSWVPVMILALLEDSVLKIVVDNSDKIVEEVAME